MTTVNLTKYFDNVVDDNWTFANSNTQYLTHALHPYPARMIPQIARKLIHMYADSKDICIDPYCGSGTVLVESNLYKIKSIGIDINPLAVLISKVKTTQIDIDLLIHEKKKLLAGIAHDLTNMDNVNIPEIPNLDYWFKNDISKKLAIIKKSIFNIDDEKIANFFKVCFSLTVRKSSNTRLGEFKLFRIPPNKLINHNPDPISIFCDITNRNIKIINEFNKFANNSVPPHIVKGDLRNILESNDDIIHEDCATLLITSPPYGDSHTTVAYGQFSRYSSAWLNFNEKEVWDLDKNILGGRKIKLNKDLESNTLCEIVDKIEKQDKNRASEVYSFFHDIDTCFKQISRIMKSNKSHICYVLGNRTVKRIQIPSDKILIELGKKYGFTHIDTKKRDIPYKQMPRINAPENISNNVGETMSKENIIIWRL